MEGVENGSERGRDRGGGTAEWVDYRREGTNAKGGGR